MWTKKSASIYRFWKWLKCKETKYVLFTNTIYFVLTFFIKGVLTHALCQSNAVIRKITKKSGWTRGAWYFRRNAHYFLLPYHKTDHLLTASNIIKNINEIYHMSVKSNCVKINKFILYYSKRKADKITFLVRWILIVL